MRRKLGPETKGQQQKIDKLKEIIQNGVSTAIFSGRKHFSNSRDSECEPQLEQQSKHDVTL